MSQKLTKHPGEPGMGSETRGNREGLGGSSDEKNPGIANIVREGDAEHDPAGVGRPPGGDVDHEAIQRGSQEGNNPQNVDSMHRPEKDREVMANSIEYSDRPAEGGKRSNEQKASRDKPS